MITYAMTLGNSKPWLPNQHIGYSECFVKLREANYQNLKLYGKATLWKGERIPGTRRTHWTKMADYDAGGSFSDLTAEGRHEIERHINTIWDLETYAKFISGPDHGLVTDPDHWAEYGITTAPQLADYIQGACERNLEKSAM